jgi:hypothetical protein
MVLSKWYTTLEADKQLMQGELVYSCPLITPCNDYDILPEDEDKARLKEADVIVLTQSCDLALDDPKKPHHPKVLTCLFYAADTYCDLHVKHKKYNQINFSKVDQIKRGLVYELCLLQCKEAESEVDYLFVDFRQVFSIPYDVVHRAAQNNQRVRLISPFIESVSQAFARCFMRIGIPNEDEIKPNKDAWDNQLFEWGADKDWPMKEIRSHLNLKRK